MKTRKLRRDIVISMTSNGDKVGVYFEDSKSSDGKGDLLFACSPEKATLCVDFWNKLGLLPKKFRSLLAGRLILSYLSKSDFDKSIHKVKIAGRTAVVEG